MIYKSFDKSASASSIQNKKLLDQKLAEELHKLIIMQFEKRKTHSHFINNILGADLADMQSISKFNEGIRFLLCDIDIFSEYAWVAPLKKVSKLTMLFTKKLIESHRKPNKIWVNKTSKFWNRSRKTWLEKNDMYSKEMCSAHNEGKSVVAE